MRVTSGWLKLIVQDPTGALSRRRGELDRRKDLEDWRRVGVSPRELYATVDAEEQLHRLLRGVGLWGAVVKESP
jgi:hypothetical protein